MRLSTRLLLFILCTLAVLGTRTIAFAAQNELVSVAVDSGQVAVSARAAEAYGKMPLSFVENNGQLNEQVRYVIRGPRASAFFRNDGVTFDLYDASTDHLNRNSRDRHESSLERLGVPQFTKMSETHIPGVDAILPSSDDQPEPRSRKHSVLKLTFEGADPDCRVEGMGELPGKVNYLTGQDSSGQHTDIPTFKGVVYKDVWSGIDVIYRGDRRQLKYDIRINPGADLSSIRLKYEGAEKIWLDKAGDLHVRTSVETFVEKVPGIYQEKDGEKIPVKGGYVLLDSQTVGFQADDYEASLSLVIDPASDLIYSTFLGGGDSSATSIAVDSTGCAYVAGATYASDFPTTSGAFQTTYNGNDDAFVTKLNASGSDIIYSTFLGGNDSDGASSIAVDSTGCVYVAGPTASFDFPTTAGAVQTTFNGIYYDAFVTKLNASGNDLIYSTYLGDGVDWDASVAVDSMGCAYVTGNTNSSDFPTTAGAFQTTLKGYSDAFVTKLDPSGSSLVYSTYLGGITRDRASSIAVDSSNCAYVVGSTDSSDFPATAGAFQATLKGYRDVFVTKLNASGAGLVYSTFLGGFQDSAASVAVDSEGCAYVAGNTSSAFPTTTGAFQRTLKGYPDAFVAKLNAFGSGLIYSTLFGEGDTYASSISVDHYGCAYLAGTVVVTRTDSCRIPVGHDYYPYITKLNASASNLISFRHLGGGYEDCNSPNETGSCISSVTVDSSGCAYVTGYTGFSDYPTTSGAFQTTFGGNRDAFVSKLNVGTFITIDSPTTASSFATSSRTLDISGTASGYMGVASITWSNDRGGSGSTSASSAWSVKQIALELGLNVITVAVTDGVGNKNTATMNVTRADTGPPILLITSPVSNGTYSSAMPSLKVGGTVSNDGTLSQVAWSSDRGPSGVANISGLGGGSSPLTWDSTINLRPGINQITFTAANSFGSRTAALTVEFIDNTPPSVQITSPTSSPNYQTTSQILTIGGVASDNRALAQIIWSSDRGCYGSCSQSQNGSWDSWTSQISLRPGANLITVTAIDAFGHKGSAVLSVNYSSVSADPLVTIASPTTGPIYNTTSPSVHLNGNVFATHSINSMTWSNDRGGSGVCTGTASWSVDNISLQIGQNVITVTATDSLGVTNKAVLSVVYSTTGNALDLVSIASDGGPSDGNSGQSSVDISAHGRFVVFDSLADNLIDGGASGCQVYMFDRQTRATKVVSTASDGTLGNRYSTTSVVTPDGRYVAFISIATNLVSGGTNGYANVFVHDMQTGQTELVSVASDGTQGNSSVDSGLAISDDGRIVAFGSSASNLVASDTNGKSDVFVHDRVSGKTQRVSVASDGTQGNGSSAYYRLAVSADGRYVAFGSKASNLVLDDTNGVDDVFVHDCQIGTTERVSDLDGRSGISTIGSGNIDISPDGRYVTFDTDGLKIYVRDRLRGSTECIGIGLHDGRVRSSADGRFMSMYNVKDDVVPGFRSAGQVLRYDRQIGEVEPVSYGFDDLPANTGCRSSTISQDGRFVAFSSYASNLVTGDYTPTSNVFVRDMGYGEPCAYPAVAISGPAPDGIDHNVISTADLTGTVLDDLDIATVAWTNDRGGSGLCVGGKSWTASGVTLYPGQNIITVTATDSAGNTGSTIMSTLPIIPAVTITSPTASPTYETTNQVLSISGTASGDLPVKSVLWTNDRGGYGMFTGTSSWSGDIKLQVGKNVITVTAIDEAGNKGTTSLSVTYVDATPLAITTKYPTSGHNFVTTSQSLYMSGNCSDSVGVTAVTWVNDRGGSGKFYGTTSWDGRVSLLPGMNVITLSATDVAGNKASTTLTVILYDDTTTPLNVKFASPSTTGSYTTSSLTLAISGTSSDDKGNVTSVTYQSDRGQYGTLTGTSSWSGSIKILPGKNVITVIAYDSVGYVGKAVLNVTFTEDTPQS